MFGRKKIQEVQEPMEIRDRVLPGIPSAFTGADTTYGEMLDMATDMAERDWTTPAEKGLAMSIIAIIKDFNQELNK